MNIWESSATNDDVGLARVKAVAMILCVLIAVSNLVSMSRWTEDRRVNDDLCYLRQAHLFQRFGVGGLDTALTRDDDSYFVQKLLKYPGGFHEKYTPCHTPIPASNKEVIQY